MARAGWIYPTVILCAYGFFKDMKPSEPFLTPYLNSTYKNIDEKNISDQIYPVSTYAYLAFLLIVFLLTDVLRYKPLIVIESLAYLATRIILIWGNGIPMMQVMQATYGLASATEIAYYSYIYVMVDEEYFRRVTSYTRAATLLGKGLSDILGQILISTKATNYLVLNYISMASVSIAVVIAMFLPHVKDNVFLLDESNYQVFDNSSSCNRTNPLINDDHGKHTFHNENEASRSSYCWRWKETSLKMFLAFKRSYGNKHMLMWSIWWAFAMCGGLQVEDYVMNLWSHITGSHTDKIYNGAVFAVGTLLSALVVFLFSLVKIQWNGILSELLIGGLSIFSFGLLFIMAKTTNGWLAYVTYVMFRATYAFVLTVASYQIALHVEMSGYALIFGCNTFIVLCFQSLLTFIVTDKKGLDLHIRSQFYVYAGYFGFIGFVFLLRPCFKGLQNARKLF